MRGGARFYLHSWMVMSPAVAGAWIGGNIDTTAAVTAAGTIAGEGLLQIATIVKVTQNALLGVLAVALTAYFALRVERTETSSRPSWSALWDRFPKFVLGFLIASIVTTIYVQTVGSADSKAASDVLKVLREWFLTAAFVCIGLELRVSSLRAAGWRPVAVFGAATGVNLVLGLALASLLFRGVTV